MKMPMLQFEQNLFDNRPIDYINPKKIVRIHLHTKFIRINIEKIGDLYFGVTKNNLIELKKIGVEEVK